MSWPLRHDLGQAMGGDERRSMLTCNTCGRSGLSESDFGFRNKQKQKRHSYCRECQNVRTRAHYRANREKYFAKNRAQLARLNAMLNDLKRQPCADCGQTFHPCVMDYDHRPGSQKLGEVSRMARTRKVGLARTLEEIAKCDLVCANCHRIRTHKRTGKHDAMCLLPS
jgi:hypothetical protein